MRKFRQLSLGLLAIAITAGCVQQATACTGIKLKSKDGSYVYGRTMEFGVDLKSNAIIIPRGCTLQGTAGGRPGLAWKATYAVVGMNALGIDQIIDGSNEKGLAGGAFYMPGFTQYEAVSEADDARTLAPWELMSWILSRFATVDEVRAALPQIRVAASLAPVIHFVPPLHFVVHDSSGGSLVIEYLHGKLTMYDNPVGVITNAPTFDWHLMNLRNYASLSPVNREPAPLDGLSVQPFGQGSGLLGMPGDFTPPSRFVRAFALGTAALEGQTGPESVEQLFHVLDSFDIPPGTVEDVSEGKPAYEFTSWTTASDMGNHVFYYHTSDNRRIRRIDLKKFDLDAKRVIHFSSPNVQDFDDLRPLSE